MSCGKRKSESCERLGLRVRRAVVLVFVFAARAWLLERALLERSIWGPQAAPSVTQSATGTNTGTGSVAATFGSDVASGVRVVVIVSKQSTETGTTISGVADTLSPSTTYAQDQISAESTGRRCFIWSGVTTATGPSTVTATFSASCSSRITVYELSNGATVDAAGGTVGDSGTSHTSMASATPGDAWGVCVMVTANATPGISAGSGWTIDAGSTSARNGAQTRTASGADTGPYATTAGTAAQSCCQFYATPAAGGDLLLKLLAHGLFCRPGMGA